MSSNESSIFRFGELTFDCGSRLLLRNGEEQRLSPKAQQLLRMLILERPRAVSREEIYDALWPSTFVSETNMAGIVSELRHALGDDARSAQYIRTVHGFGYAFAGDVQTGDSEPMPVPVAVLRGEGQRHLLYEGENVIGRSVDCRVVLNEPTVSRRHAAILISGDTIVVEDRGSTNGTYVNGQKIRRWYVRDKDTIRFGTMPMTISRGISSTAPLPLYVAEGRRHSSGSNAPA
ncbi:MAG TPA: FHA domain-containing protein [Thermoanaerobaculia bacterium]